MNWYIEKADLNITDIDPWWGGVEFGETIPNNSLLVSENSLLLPAGSGDIFSTNADAYTSPAPAIAVGIIVNLKDNLKGYRGDGIGNLALLQQWKEEGLTEEGISHMYKRQWNDIMINMVTPTREAKINGTIQLTLDKTCYNPYFSLQYLISIVGLIIIICIFIATIINVNSLNFFVFLMTNFENSEVQLFASTLHNYKNLNDNNLNES